MYVKTVLRELDERRLNRYLTPKEARVQLRYPLSCLGEETGEFDWGGMVGIGYVKKRNQTELAVCDSNLETILKAKVVHEEDSDKLLYQLKTKIQRIVAGKVVVGFNLNEMLDLFQIEHSAFIDIAHLYPQRFPGRLTTLSRISLSVIGLPLSREDKYQYEREQRRCPELQSSDEDNRGRRGRYQFPQINTDYVVSKESANFSLKIAEKHIQQGRGILHNIQTPIREFQNINQILEEAEIDKETVCGLFLRGSRALGIELTLAKYVSDWDYVCVIETAATVNCLLLKVHNVDLILFDRRSFAIYVNGGDLPMIELFSLPAHCIYVNRLPPPIISARNSKYSLIHHLWNCDKKLSYYAETFYKHFGPNRNYFKTSCVLKQAEPNPRYDRRPRRMRGRKHELIEMQKSSDQSNANPEYVKWKFIKVMHMQVRFVDQYLQIRDNGRIMDPLAMTPFWRELQAICDKQGHHAAYEICKEKLKQLLQMAFRYKQLCIHRFNCLNLQSDNSRQGYRRRRRHLRSRRRQRHYQSDVDYQLLSIYRSSSPLSSDPEQCARIDDIEVDEEDFDPRYDLVDQVSQAAKMILNTTHLHQEASRSPFFSLFTRHANFSQSQFNYLLAPYFVKSYYYFFPKYIQQTRVQQPQGDVSSLISYRPLENANFELPIVQQATASIFRQCITEFYEKTSVKSLVCFMYEPFQEYGKIRDNCHSVHAYEAGEYDIYEKRDGLFTVLYYSGDGWLVGTRKTADAREVISSGSSITVHDQFLRIFKDLGYLMPSEQARTKVFYFELLSTNIKNSLPKTKDELILHGVRNMKTLEEEDHEQYALHFDWKYAKRVDLGTKELSMIASIAEGRQDCEGYILRDSHFKRMVIRNSSIMKQKWSERVQQIQAQPQFLFSQDTLIDKNRTLYFLYSEIVLKNRDKEYLEVFPESRQIINSILAYIREVNAECMELREAIQAAGLTWEDAAIDELLADRRIDVLTYLRGYCFDKFPEMFKGRVQASVNFNKTFAFLLQHIHNCGIN